MCQHSEGSITRTDGTARIVLGHDCRYVDARNALIPEAERRASAIIRAARPLDGDPTKLMGWTAAFMQAMNELAIERGIVKSTT